MNSVGKQFSDTSADMPGLVSVVRTCQRRPALLAELEQVYDQADKQIAKLAPSCRACGECCKFPQAGHRLYLTGMELAYLTIQEPASAEQAEIGLCPYQRGQQCTARKRRSLGCRTYFCDKHLSASLQSVHELGHEQVRDLHDKWGIDYLYAELTSSLMQCLDDVG